jgi:hypothetical protein
MEKPEAQRKTLTGIGWYRPEQWPRLREISMDADTLEETHAKWLEFASKAFKNLGALGDSVVKVDIDVEEILRWCQQKGLPVDAKARASFIVHKVQQMGEANQ